jgi:hypothetical protein
MAFAAGWNARQELVEASNSAEETRPVGETNKQMEAAFTCALTRLHEQEFITVDIEQLPEVAERLNAYLKKAMQS